MQEIRLSGLSQEGITDVLRLARTSTLKTYIFDIDDPSELIGHLLPEGSIVRVFLSTDAVKAEAIKEFPRFALIVDKDFKFWDLPYLWVEYNGWRIDKGDDVADTILAMNSSPLDLIDAENAVNKKGLFDVEAARVEFDLDNRLQEKVLNELINGNLRETLDPSTEQPIKVCIEKWKTITNEEFVKSHTPVKYGIMVGPYHFDKDDDLLIVNGVLEGIYANNVFYGCKKRSLDIVKKIFSGSDFVHLNLDTIQVLTKRDYDVPAFDTDKLLALDLKDYDKKNFHKITGFNLCGEIEADCPYNNCKNCIFKKRSTTKRFIDESF